MLVDKFKGQFKGQFQSWKVRRLITYGQSMRVFKSIIRNNRDSKKTQPSNLPICNLRTFERSNVRTFQLTFPVRLHPLQQVAGAGGLVAFAVEFAVAPHLGTRGWDFRAVEAKPVE